MKQNLLKKCIGLVLCVSLALSTCACSLTDTSIDELMRPPQLTQSRQQVQQAIQELLGTSYQLIAPAGGEHRSSINLQDLDNDGQNEAICFFTIGDIQLLDVLVLRKQGKEWVRWGRFSSDATKVEQLAFTDLNEDGITELVVGWSYLTGSEKLMEVLQLGDDKLSSKYKQKHTRFAIADGQVVVIEQGAATLLGHKKTKITSLSSVSMAPDITSFTALTVSTADGNPAIYLDVQTEDHSFHTEVLVIKSKKYLENKLFTEEALYRTRPYNVHCTDIDNDGVPEVPNTRVMENGDSSAYYTEWSDFDGATLSAPLVTYTAASDQFYLVYPDKWRGEIFVRQDSKMQRLYHFINKKDDILYSLRVFTVTEYSQIYVSEGWVTLVESTDKVIAYRKGDVSDEKFALTTAEWGKALRTY